MRHSNAVRALAVLPVLSLAPKPVVEPTLVSLRHNYRPLLIFAAAYNQEFRQQMQILEQRPQDVEERQILIVPVLLNQDKSARPWDGALPERDVVEFSLAEETSARQRFKIGGNEFAVILVGKDGGEKLRSKAPVTMELLAKRIDSMPMRQKEVRDGHLR